MVSCTLHACACVCVCVCVGTSIAHALSHADETPRDMDQGVPGDGEVPLDNIKRVISTLVRYHIPTKAATQARLKATRTSIFRHEDDSFQCVFGDPSNDMSVYVWARFCWAPNRSFIHSFSIH